MGDGNFAPALSKQRTKTKFTVCSAMNLGNLERKTTGHKDRVQKSAPVAPIKIDEGQKKDKKRGL